MALESDTLKIVGGIISGIIGSNVLSYFFAKRPTRMEKASAEKIETETSITLWKELLEAQGRTLKDQQKTIKDLSDKLSRTELKLNTLAQEILILRGENDILKKQLSDYLRPTYKAVGVKSE